MYEAFFGFREKPFNLTPDPKYLYLSAKHSEAFAHLEFGLKQRGGFVVITGEVGTGKTTLCRYFLDRLDENTVSAFILYPSMGAVELLRSICEDLGIEEHGWTAKEWVDILHRFLLEARARDKNIVLVIDEAQNLDVKLLEQIRLISNLETTTEKLIQIVLIGQSELNELLARNDLRQLAQRITARYHLNPLNREETGDYIRHRLGVVGGAGKVMFARAALRRIHHFSRGIPRLINLVCDRALLAGFVLGCREIDGKVIRRAIGELDAVHKNSATKKTWHGSWKLRGAAAALALAGLALAFGPEAQRLLPWSQADEKRPPKLTDHTVVVSEPVREAPPAVPEKRDIADLSSGELEARLRTVSKELSRRGSAEAVLERWGVQVENDAMAFSPDESLQAIARRSGLELTQLRSHFEQIRRLNLPVVLELFHTTRSDTCFAALAQLDGDVAVVAFGPDDTLRVSRQTLEQFWVHRTFVFWKDFEKLADTGSKDSRVQAWVERALKKIGYLSSDVELSDDAVKAGIIHFQSSNYLSADGVVGPKTAMALYSLSNEYPVPRLKKP
jgi:general secretion pathway protein A